jgi:endonuclease/exonuclease/phosphatase family metal-dependent hydrolase
LKAEFSSRMDARTEARSSIKHSTIKIVTYNIHKCKGIDGRVSPERIVSVLQEVDADVIALQEVVSKNGGGVSHQARFIADALMMDCVSGPNIVSEAHEYGNIVLTRLPISSHRNHNISVGHREPRGCLQVDVKVKDTLIHFFNTHFGTAYLERARQARALFDEDILGGNKISGPRILVGDLNDWFAGHAIRRLRNELRDASPGLQGWRKRTHPCLLPIFKLDKIFIESSIQLSRCYVHRSRLARVASDHLPLIAHVEVPAKSSASDIPDEMEQVEFIGQNQQMAENDSRLNLQ